VRRVPEPFRRQAAVLKALAHPTRLFVADLLSRGPLCVCEIRDRVGADLSTVSKHLAVMTRAGVLSRRKKGLQVHYRLKTPCVTGFFACTLRVMKASR
jgi:ArsR family transcriptional regulator